MDKNNFKQNQLVQIKGLKESDQLYNKVGQIVGKSFENIFDIYIVLFDEVIEHVGYSAVAIPEQNLIPVEHKFNVGDRVKVSRIVLEEDGWLNSWVENMHRRINHVGIITLIEPDNGIRIQFGDSTESFQYPPSSLDLV